MKLSQKVRHHVFSKTQCTYSVRSYAAIKFGYQHLCKWLPGKTFFENDSLRV